MIFLLSLIFFIIMFTLLDQANMGSQGERREIKYLVLYLHQNKQNLRTWIFSFICLHVLGKSIW